MKLSNKQIKQISRSIQVSDIKKYIETHSVEFEQFLEEEKQKEELLG